MRQYIFCPVLILAFFSELSSGFYQYLNRKTYQEHIWRGFVVVEIKLTHIIKNKNLSL